MELDLLKKHRVAEGKWHERVTSRYPFLEGGVPHLEKDLAEETEKKGSNEGKEVC